MEFDVAGGRLTAGFDCAVHTGEIAVVHYCELRSASRQELRTRRFGERIDITGGRGRQCVGSRYRLLASIFEEEWPSQWPASSRWAS